LLNLRQQELTKAVAVRDLKSELKEPESFDLSEYDDLIQTINEVDQQQAVIDSKINEIKRAQRTIGGKCPVCLQPVGKDHLGQLEKHFLELKTERNSLVEDRRVLDAEKVRINVVRLAHMADQEKARHVMHNLQLHEREILHLRRRILEVKEEKNEFSDLISSKRNEYDCLQVTLTETLTQISDLQEQYTATHYWVAGFKRLRLYIVEEALKSLEIEVNNNLAALGLADWKIQFDIEREKKDGGFSKGFSVIIIHPSGNSIRFETFSGGESQLFRLAGALGLSNLICERAGLVNKIEILDEPSSHLSKEAVLSLTELLHQRAIQTDRRIFLIDHSAIEFGDFQSVITVVKDAEGSRIVQS
jgi:DNA repair exonuclease SbcCD ATPase subunit